jgi:adenosylhomocysteinase
MKKMKNGAILANSGHFNVEISIDDLLSLAKSRETVRPNVEKFELKNERSIYLLAEGRLVNLASAEGHPPEVMMMSFANQALSAEYLVESGRDLNPSVYKVPEDIDKRIASIALKVMGIQIDKLTEEQAEYLKGWEKGTI